MQHCADTLREFGVDFVSTIVSAHRTPDTLFEYAKNARQNGVKVIIAGAGGAAHLPGMLASKTSVPIIGVPVSTTNLNGLDSLLSIVQMPAGVPVGTMSIGKSGAINAALYAISMLAIENKDYQVKLDQYRANQTQEVLDNLNPENG